MGLQFTVFKCSVPSFWLVQLFKMISFRPCTKLRNKREIKEKFPLASFPLPVPSWFLFSSSFLAHFDPIPHWYAKRIFTNDFLTWLFLLFYAEIEMLCVIRAIWAKFEHLKMWQRDGKSYVTEPKKDNFVILTHLLKDINTQTLSINFVIHCKIPSQSKILLKLSPIHFFHPNSYILHLCIVYSIAWYCEHGRCAFSSQLSALTSNIQRNNTNNNLNTFIICMLHFKPFLFRFVYIIHENFKQITIRMKTIGFEIRKWYGDSVVIF